VTLGRPQTALGAFHEEEIVRRRTSYEQKLRSICEDVERGGVKDNTFEALRSMRPFYLAYQGNNDRELQRLFGELTCRIIGQTFPETSLASAPAPDEPVRVGFVSSFFYTHSNWKIPLKGWMGQLDRKRFRIFGYHVGETRDAETNIAAAMCDRFVHRSLSIEGWRREILHDAPHVLTYPGLLMDEVSHRLAAQRLAAVQCNSWGHPETSGMPTLDYFLSSDLRRDSARLLARIPRGRALHFARLGHSEFGPGRGSAWLQHVRGLALTWFRRLKPLGGAPTGFIEGAGNGYAIIEMARVQGLNPREIDAKYVAAGKDARALLAEPHATAGRVKIGKSAFDKRTNYRGNLADHLMRQVTGFRAFDKDAYRREDDLSDAAIYSVLVSLGDGTEMRWSKLKRVV
jgi:hypothetical protein